MTAVRRKPALTYQSPAQSEVALHLETTVFASRGTTGPVSPMTPPTPLSEISELPQRSIVMHKSSRHHHMTGPLLPLYHPFGTLALSLPDLDPTVFGLPAPVAVFDDPTRRSSHRQRRPAAKIRDAEEPATLRAPSLTAETSTLEPEAKERPSPRRRRGGGKRRRREAEDGDATYPAKRARHPRNSGISSGLAGTRKEEGSPAPSNGTLPALEGGRGDPTEEKKPERRGTRSRGGLPTRRGSTASEETVTSVSPPGSCIDTGGPRVGSNGEPNEGEERGGKDTSGIHGTETQKGDSEDADPEGREN